MRTRKRSFVVLVLSAVSAVSLIAGLALFNNAAGSVAAQLAVQPNQDEAPKLEELAVPSPTSPSPRGVEVARVSLEGEFPADGAPRGRFCLMETGVPASGGSDARLVHALPCRVVDRTPWFSGDNEIGVLAGDTRRCLAVLTVDTPDVTVDSEPQLVTAACSSESARNKSWAATDSVLSNVDTGLVVGAAAGPNVTGARDVEMVAPKDLSAYGRRAQFMMRQR